MRIGILTFHRAHNYGAVLQCYALQSYLERLGHNVFVIDYRQSFIEQVYKPFSLRKFIKICFRPKTLFGYCSGIFSRKDKKRQYDKFCNKNLNLTGSYSKFNIPLDYDVYIIGSDQLWNPILTGGDDFVYWGEFGKFQKLKLITYAISTNIECLKSYDINLLKSRLENFYTLSAREDDIANYLNKVHTGKVSVVLDPTLLSDRSIWNHMLNGSIPEEEYIVIYSARTYHKQPDILLKKAELLAKNTGLKIINFNEGIYSPTDFVTLIAHAKYVITSSFHAVAFSVIFERKLFAVKYGDSHDARYVNLLSNISASNLLVDIDFTPHTFDFDYKKCTEALAELRKQSVNYLSNALSQ